MKEILLANGTKIPISENDYLRIHQRVMMGGMVEGAVGLDNGDILILQNVVLIMTAKDPGVEMRRIFGKNKIHVTRTMLLDKLGVEDEGQVRAELMDQVMERF